ncbi:MAG: hypothetical protein ACI89X_002352 [Planctomycetota bacterium]|jgi:hypothetical protein
MRKRPSLVVQALFASCLFAPQPLFAQGGNASKVEPFAVIQQDYDDAYQRWSAAYREAMTSGADKDVVAKLRAERPDGAAYLGRVLKVIKAKPTDEDGASAAIWMLRVARVQGAELGQALDVLQQHHADSTQLKDVMLTLSRNASPGIALFLEKIKTASTSVDIRGRACFALAMNLKSRARMVRSIATAGDGERKRLVAALGREAIDVLKTEDPAAHEARSAKWFKAVIADKQFAAIDYFRGTLGDRAERTLFELRNLSVGKVAPDIVGEDIDGTALKLSDYRGKVVVLDFWGDW